MKDGYLTGCTYINPFDLYLRWWMKMFIYYITQISANNQFSKGKNTDIPDIRIILPDLWHAEF